MIESQIQNFHCKVKYNSEMLVVETSDGVKEHKGEEKEIDPPPLDWNDDDMKEFRLKNNLTDLRQPLLQSKFTVDHLAQMNQNADGDAYWMTYVIRNRNSDRHRSTVSNMQSHHSINKDRKLKKKIIIIGDTAVGKSQILRALEELSFQHGKHAELTVGVECSIMEMSINDRVSITFRIWDTAGQESFRSITQSYYRGADAAFIVYDISRRETFNHLSQWIKLFTQCSGATLPLVGNKLDLEHRRRVAIDEAKRFAIEK